MSENIILECPGCGAKITSGMRVCDYCGSALKAEELKNESTGAVQNMQGNLQAQPQTASQFQGRPSNNQPVQKTKSGVAVAAFVLSILGISPIAFILGIVASARISKPNSNLTGRGFAVVAIILSIVQMLIFTIIYVSR
jgi:hypothetical protein